MAAILCQGVQTRLESLFLEPRTTLRLTFPFSKTRTPLLPPPQPVDLTFKSSFCDSNTKPCYEETEGISDDKGGLSFHQVLSNVCHSDKESVYLHPQVRRSSLVLSDKSLELCTENLGNETGTDITGNSIELLSSLSECGGTGDSPTREQISSRAARGGSGGKKARAQNFPPPLTTMRGSESLRVLPHRENGRLVIEAVRVTSSGSCFKAERNHGRLRLRLLKSQTPCFDSEENEEATESDVNEEEDEEGTEEKGEEDDEKEEEKDALKYERPRVVQIRRE